METKDHTREHFRFLNKKETKPITEFLEEQFGFTAAFDYVVILSTKNRIYITHRDIEKINLTELRISSVGAYFGELLPGAVRLSIEGTQLIGPHATKNVIELDDKQADEWLKGYELEYDGPCTGFVILKHGKDYLGCGKVKLGRILNYVNKARRIRATV